jgi:hypothetical protein
MAPAAPHDANGLLTAAIGDDNPVLFCELKLGDVHSNGPVSAITYARPTSKADVQRHGSDARVVAIMCGGITAWHGIGGPAGRRDRRGMAHVPRAQHPEHSSWCNPKRRKGPHTTGDQHWGGQGHGRQWYSLCPPDFAVLLPGNMPGSNPKLSRGRGGDADRDHVATIAIARRDLSTSNRGLCIRRRSGKRAVRRRTSSVGTQHSVQCLALRYQPSDLR